MNWLKSLKDAKGRTAIRAKVARARLGNLGDCQPVGDGVQEMRIHYGPGYRIYFGWDGAALVILLCGGDKAGQERDIAKAKRYWLDYRSRNDDEEQKFPG